MKGTISQITSLFILLSIILSLAACKHDPLTAFEEVLPETNSTGGNNNIVEDACDPDSVYFKNDVLPILVSNCAISSCHDPETHKEGIILSTYDDVIESNIISTGDPLNSDMLERILDDDLEDRMPPAPDAPLSSEEVDILVAWMEQGALDNSCEECDTTAVTYAITVTDIMASYCLGCHGGSSPSGGISLEDYVGVAEVASSGQLEGALRGYSGYTQMPLGSDALPDCKIDAIVTWIESGYPNN